MGAHVEGESVAEPGWAIRQLQQLDLLAQMLDRLMAWISDGRWYWAQLWIDSPICVRLVSREVVSPCPEMAGNLRVVELEMFR